MYLFQNVPCLLPRCPKTLLAFHSVPPLAQPASPPWLSRHLLPMKDAAAAAHHRLHPNSENLVTILIETRHNPNTEKSVAIQRSAAVLIVLVWLVDLNWWSCKTDSSGKLPVLDFQRPLHFWSIVSSYKLQPLYPIHTIPDTLYLFLQKYLFSQKSIDWPVW